MRREVRKNLHRRSSRSASGELLPLEKDLSWKSAYRTDTWLVLHRDPLEAPIECNRLWSRHRVRPSGLHETHPSNPSLFVLLPTVAICRQSTIRQPVYRARQRRGGKRTAPQVAPPRRFTAPQPCSLPSPRLRRHEFLWGGVSTPPFPAGVPAGAKALPFAVPFPRVLNRAQRRFCGPFTAYSNTAIIRRMGVAAIDRRIRD